MDIKMESDDETDFIGFSSPQEMSDKVMESRILAKQLHVYKEGIDYIPGAKLEVLDARDNNWYLCKVVEVDWGELDILVHYEKWSVRFDEWLKMDSTRLRKTIVNAKESKKAFHIKEKVLAYWGPDGKYYSAEVVKQISEDCWSVLFYDGFTRALRSSHLRKVEDNMEVPKVEPDNVKPKPIPKPQIPQLEPVPAPALSRPKVEEHFVGGSKSNIFDVRIMEEKRKSKRNPAVEKLFQSIRKRRRSEKDDDEIFTRPQKRVKTSEEHIVDDPDTSYTKSSDDESSSNVSSHSVVESDSDSCGSVETCGTTAYPQKESADVSKDDNIYETINIGSIVRSCKQDSVQFSSSNVSPSVLSSPEDLGFKGFEPVSSADKYRFSETLSSLLGIPIPMENHLCPKDGCGKSFMNESLLRMHVKHYHRSATSHFPGLAKRSLQNAVERIHSDSIKIEDTSSNDLALNHLKEEPSMPGIETKRTFISSVGRKSSAGKNSVREVSVRGNGKAAVSECLSESDVQDFTVGRPRNSKKKRSHKLKPVQFSAETDYNTPDSPDKSDMVEKSDPDAIINCRCGFREEDGLMLQCDICLCWQHGSCYQIESESQVPNSYICSICENSDLQRNSMRFRHHQDWLKEGKLPRFSGSEASPRLESLIRKCHDVMGNVLSLSDVMHSLNLKLYISKSDDHPKLVMWHKKWLEEEERPIGVDQPTPQSESIPRGDKTTVSAVSRDNGIDGQLLDIDRFSGLRINGASTRDDLTRFNSKPPPPMPAYGNDNDGRKSSSDKLEVMTFDLTDASNPTSGAPNSKAIAKTEGGIDREMVAGSSCPEQKGERYSSNWKDNPSLEMHLENKIKIEQDDSDATLSLEPDTKETMILDPVNFPKEEPMSDDQKEAIDDMFDFSLPGLLSGSNVGSDLTDLLSSNAELERFVHQASTELAPMDGQIAPIMQRAPIIPQAERIIPVKCRLNLLEHIEKMQNCLFNRFDLIENHIQALEGEMGLTSKFTKEEEEMLCNEASENRDEITLQSRSLVRMSLRDLETATKLINYKPS